MGALLFYGQHQSQQFIFRQTGRLYGRHAETAGGQRTCFVEDDGIHAGDGIQVIASLKQDTHTGSRPYSSEIAQRDADNQRARAGYYEEHQPTIEPIVEHIVEARMHRRNKCGKGYYQDSQKHHYRCIDAGKPPDKQFGRRFALCCVLHKVEDACQCAVVVRFRHQYAHCLSADNHTGKDITACGYIAGHALPGQRRSIENGLRVLQSSVQRDTFAGFYFNGFSHIDVAGRDCPERIFTIHIHPFGAHIEQAADIAGSLVHGFILQHLSQGIE